MMLCSKCYIKDLNDNRHRERDAVLVWGGMSLCHVHATDELLKMMNKSHMTYTEEPG